jgi:hypothetical protein
MTETLTPRGVNIIDAETGEHVAEISLEHSPHPGSYLQVGSQGYLVLEKRHSYSLRAGHYVLHAIRAFVRPAPPMTSETEGIIGNASCRYNAHSPLLRCAVNPQGPCEGCLDYSP